MLPLDIEALRAEIRAMDFVRRTPEDVARWRDDDRDSRHNLIIEGMTPEPDEDALFAMLMDEAVPSPIVIKLLTRLAHADAGRTS